MDDFMPAVRLDNVTKTFGTHIAVNDLSLEVPAGTIYGFIGPNGSGKTTTLRMIMHILHPDRGEISVLGEKATSAANDRVGLSARGARPVQADEGPRAAALLRRAERHAPTRAGGRRLA